jgi:DNA-cytosine methyltransferase
MEKENGDYRMNTLSLFDGMSCLQLAMQRAGIKIDNYFASEIEKAPIKVAMKHFPNTVQLGDVNNYKNWDLPQIDFLAAGSPCQDLTKLKTDGKGLHGEKSKLFFKFVESLHKYKPKHFLLENVVMSQENNDIITSILGIEPIEINSERFSAQDRPRLYWTNIPFDKNLPVNNTVFADVMEHDVDDYYFYNDKFEKFYGENKRLVGTLEQYYPNGKRKFWEIISRVYNPDFKMATLTAVSGGHQEKKVYINGRTRKLTPIEYERLQNVPDNWTDSVARGARYKMLGNGFTVDVIAHLLKGLKDPK